MFLMLSSLFISVLFALVIFQARRENPKKIFGIYSQPGKWYYLKYILAYLVLSMRKYKKIAREVISNDESNQQQEMLEKKQWEKLEKLQELSTHDKAFDAVFFQAASANGYYLSAGIERRHHAKVNGVFYLVVPELGLLHSTHLPNAECFADPITLLEMKDYSGGGLTITPVKPMKVWKMSFINQMCISDEKGTGKLVDVQLDATWTSNSPHFLFERDMSIEAMARALALETWNKRLFETLKSAHQSHYEQMGQLNGSVIIDGKRHLLSLDSFRDHSFGHKREWSLLHRYSYHVLHLTDGRRLTVAVVSQPATTSNLTLGYVTPVTRHSHTTTRHTSPITTTAQHYHTPIDHCDLALYQHGEGGSPPDTVTFTCRAGRATYVVSVSVVAEHVHYKGDTDKGGMGGKARIVERFVTCRVNGVAGRGVSEWQYGV